MMRHTATAFAAVMVGVWIVACVGDDPTSSGADPNVPVGQYRGACTADNKCLQGLECTQGVCLYPPDGGPAQDGSGSSSGGSSSGGSSSSGSSGADGSASCTSFASPAGTDAKIQCGNAGVCATTCCFENVGDPRCDVECTHPADKNLPCDSRNQCGGDSCCLKIEKSEINATVCPFPVPFFDLGAVQCVPAGCDRASAQYQMCRNDAECTGPDRCFPIEVTTGGTKLSYGVCY